MNARRGALLAAAAIAATAEQVAVAAGGGGVDAACPAPATRSYGDDGASRIVVLCQRVLKTHDLTDFLVGFASASHPNS